MSPNETPWTLKAEDYDFQAVLRAKASTSVSVLIPARNEAATIGPVLEAVKAHGQLIDDLVVIDDNSVDDTATIASHHGARVIHVEGHGGKGVAMRTGLEHSESDVVVFLDADVLNTGSDFVGRLIQPLLERQEIQLVKGYYERPLHNMPTGGGRVNELAARPILSLLYPGLGEIRQPLAGETAGRRSTFESITLERTYGVEIALLIDIAREHGVSSIAQVDLGVRRHRNRPLEELRPMSVDVLRAALKRFSVELPPQV
jgi:glucosyl-3-phosphoglycerate synthase